MAKKRKNEDDLFSDVSGADGQSLSDPGEPTSSRPLSVSASSFPTNQNTAGGGDATSQGATGSGGAREGGIALHEAAQDKYLNYALSVITSRALPDVRDGLKPVQRRILFTMWQQGLTADVKHRKCAKVIGDVMGNYHPHGDSAIYEALVRMAQPFSLRHPLVDGSGNFGSLDGDAAAAMRYTECRLARISDEMLTELDQATVPMRPNYDGTREEPVVLPARLPNLLINGSMGIAVGMATNIPPHHLGETCKALLKLLDDPEIKVYQLVANDAIQGPDFPTGGQILNSREEIREIYKTGQGAIRLRGTWENGSITRSGKTVIINSIPYTVNKSQLVERIAQVVLDRKLPPLVDVRDLSAEDVRIELTLKKDADEELVLAYLCKHTPLQVNFNVNLTCLIPTEKPEVGRPERLDLKVILWHFLHFRLDVVTKRLSHEREQLGKRIHILEGFAKVFDALDEIIRIIRKSEGKADAAKKIIERFKLDAEQTDAILELKLYRLARLEILLIEKELEEKRARAKEIDKLLAEQSAKGRWKMVRQEIEEILAKYGKPEKRRTLIEEVVEQEFKAEDFIIEEDNVVIVTRDGWVKRQKEVKDASSTRLREGDSVLAMVPGSTRTTVTFFTNFGTAYTSLIADIPASTGYGEPIQKLFKLKDGEKLVAAISMDPRITPNTKSPGNDREGLPLPAPTHALAATSDGYALRFGLETFVEPSTRAGRRYARPSGVGEPGGAEVVGMTLVHGDEIVLAATKQAHAMVCKVNEINHLSGPGKGVLLVKLQQDDDRLLGFMTVLEGERKQLVVETSRGAQQTISTAKYEATARGGKGREVMKTGTFERIVWEESSALVKTED